MILDGSNISCGIDLLAELNGKITTKSINKNLRYAHVARVLASVKTSHKAQLKALKKCGFKKIATSQGTILLMRTMTKAEQRRAY